MESSRGRRRCRSVLMVVALFFFFVVAAISLCCARSWACSGSDCGGWSTVVARSGFGRRPAASCANQEDRSRGGRQWRRRRLLVDGPGSYPPRCTSKCGSCNPCYPVHVAVPPGVPVTAEYYPEAWRCRCGNRLYMP
ncbi:uncharacterized protein LOC104582892 [Brachypodium distachyon]|uniref:Epidermal patterning factor-like protein n=1 Tax=Brachypodium distachyon TaxID=15368 RepID=A0A0Q3GH48_BRADI|nr:uncharacterized protein LOC104582892 [Brachypodium distachyon]XP_014754785.1 uncharacterized protein LOC104582892 [Brachypodium distachyon]XP_014754787.1 uncharacterized protein LOC104582892 [Brachypodium distachyon]XP_014754788.1 uncharacterized protein LOC104582892 [Brachypodium distachyon]XP_014754789.1 uncharacterized protein LOC104582892 [Brachypodium distachyon]XP_024314748.1 uncharacterized protein LOC104582892 [Brachypodium distachyon]KQK10374.1 hypothetical protein BRADI_2g53661v3|eukprot:XP_014754784.1 uncharacterized protein LOC104582892 [Brachypodium distachyon]